MTRQPITATVGHFLNPRQLRGMVANALGVGNREGRGVLERPRSRPFTRSCRGYRASCETGRRIRMATSVRCRAGSRAPTRDLTGALLLTAHACPDKPRTAEPVDHSAPPTAPACRGSLAWRAHPAAHP